MTTPRRPPAGQATIDDIMRALDRIGTPANGSSVSNAERLARIEALLEGIVSDLAEAKSINKRFERLEQRGLGWLAGVGLVGGAVGATVKTFWVQIFGSAG